ncbi:MAG TPA: fibronectin type III domain-containing protein [Steroidobacteraceae bacterium]|nr:fibronectin type III domain-containing protein [Steroidobacteraceae bacterium]
MRDDRIRSLATRGASIAVLALLLCGCGGDDDKKSATAANPPTTGTAPPAPAPVTPPPQQPPPVSTARAATVEWLAPQTMTDGSTLTNLAGYRIYYGTEVARMNRTIEVKNAGVLSYVIEGLAPATYYFAVTAINSHGHESARSNAGRKIIT